MLRQNLVMVILFYFSFAAALADKFTCNAELNVLLQLLVVIAITFLLIYSPEQGCGNIKILELSEDK